MEGISVGVEFKNSAKPEEWPRSVIFDGAEAIRFSDTFRFYKIKKYRLAFLCPKFMQLRFEIFDLTIEPD
jgi:hypothetical protein